MLSCPAFEQFFGGARGGGKTDGMLGEWMSHAFEHGKDAIGLMVRRTRTELVETIQRSIQLFTPLGWKWKEQDKMWTSPAGARLRFAYLERDQDAESYQGHSYTRIYIEEIGNFRSPKPIMKLMATLRSGAGVPCGFRATGNPGGPGHMWVRDRYIDPEPRGYKVIVSEFLNPFTNETVTRDRIFIPSRLTDNKYLGGEYVAQLQMSGSKELVRAWLEGDWAAIEGAFFDGWSNKNVVDPFEVPADWLRFRSGDWGFAAPFSIGWWAVAGDDHTLPGGQVIPRGAIVRYREWYGSNGKPNEGLRLTAEEVAKGIRDREDGEKITYGVMDPAAFSQDGGPSLVERMAKEGVRWRRADNKRVSTRGALSGWDQMRARIKGTDGVPMLYVFDTCTDFLRTIPVLQHDPDRLEDLDTKAEDHVADEVRYGCASRPWVPSATAQKGPDKLIYEYKDGRVQSNMGVREIVEARMRRQKIEGRV